MTNNNQMTVINGSGNGRCSVMNGWVDLQLVQARVRGTELADEAQSARLAKSAGRRDAAAPTLRVRFEAAVAAWRQPGRAAAA